MSKEQFRSFLEAVNTDSALQEKLKEAAEPDAVAAIAQSAGFESVSPELVTDFLEYVAAQSASEQEGDQELSAVSGGKMSTGAITGIAAAVATTVGAAVAVYAGYESKSYDSNFTAVRTQSFDSLMGDTTHLAAWQALKIETSNLKLYPF